MSSRVVFFFLPLGAAEHFATSLSAVRVCVCARHCRVPEVELRLRVGLVVQYFWVCYLVYFISLVPSPLRIFFFSLRVSSGWETGPVLNLH